MYIINCQKNDYLTITPVTETELLSIQAVQSI
nr:MAG TPA: hypothetical protein [Caudoviricetes sp.]